MEHLIEYRYLALFLTACAEGPVASFVTGSLVAAGIFAPLPAFGILVLKDLILDVLFYGVGRTAHIPFIARRVSGMRESTKLADDVLSAIEHGWRDHPVRLMWIGKLAYGLSAWFLVSAGIAKLPFKKLYFYTLPATVFQFGGLMLLGYFLGAAAWYFVGKWVFGIEIVLAAIAVFFGVRKITRYVREHYVEDVEA